MLIIYFILYISTLLKVTIATPESDLIARLNSSLSVTEDILADIFDDWQISKYPNFLQSAAMTHTSWEVLKLKYQVRILESAKSQFKDDKNIVISFMGSSVTAGHDSPFNVSFPILTQTLMSRAFKPLNINLITRNAAMGNNPCMPYDICVKTFAGQDADIVHWEQSFNCFLSEDDVSTKSVFEQFVRQSLTLPNQPVVVFSQSDTPNWEAKDCAKEKKPHTITPLEDELLKSLGKDPINIPTHLNKNEITKWNVLLEILKSYKIAGIQMFSHTAYDVYKCLGPYDKDWGCCAAAWHPSIKGHRVRAAHYSFFWLLIYKDALKDLINKLSASNEVTVESIFSMIEKHVAKEHKYIPSTSLYPSNISDAMQCFTNFEPRYEPGTDIESILVPNIHGWKKAIFEEFLDKHIIEKAKSRGYLDYKYMFYGNKKSGPLSININVKSPGHVFICQTPGNWGKLPDKFKNFWEIGTQFYSQSDIVGGKDYLFDKNMAEKLTYFNDKPQDSQHVCVQFHQKFQPGRHVLTILPSEDDINIILSVLLIP